MNRRGADIDFNAIIIVYWLKILIGPSDNAKDNFENSHLKKSKTF
jgi:hypothetical protein